MSQYEVTLLLGSNLGDTKKNIETALHYIEKEFGPILRRSDILLTKPVEFASNNIFCNIVVLIKTQFSPIKLLNFIKKIEFDMGRIEDSSVTNAYLDRIIDIDIVLYGDLKFDCKTLNIPHKKHLYEREFSRNLLMSIKRH
ncbi:2-amino-4-hydroxy-6-hydroxymethyldihydropteridinediphosphokinase [Kaistella chaponensis]|uniref:2-amino-4-hydroxy-6-hydroxymethyldihydropteridine pyrophosphokinase n=1 Tax=Kaistella chaponensis TaxID=713588 RepID=A0A1N7JNG1_9FLAO|nr:2-amino-4-hydroxy-6-hydroxymethyldihydropteridine diphosphokinase [Kaistella chaponensis]SIS50847.1 2-amino-4-hydroxy-6-hydroxymethyldihydropteridinediphosphokinase [Kaistella chaponensis]